MKWPAVLFAALVLFIRADVAGAVDPTAKETVVSPESAAADAAYEATSVLNAADFLTEAERIGSDYRVADHVVNDGLMNHYVVEAPAGRLEVEGTDLLRVRLVEIAALQRFDAIKETTTYGDAFAAAVKSPYHAAKALVTEPVATVKSVGGGVGRFFGRADLAVAGKPSEQEDGIVKTTLGFDVYKRSLAYEAGVDPYTSYAPLTDRLNELAWTGFAGGFTVGALLTAVPGPVGVTLQATSFSEGMRKLVRDKSPSELKKHNSELLVGMKLDKSLVAAFLDHPRFSPTMTTRIVGALATMRGVTGRDVLIARATLAQDESDAFYGMRQAEMIAAYHESVAKVARFVQLRDSFALETKDGAMTFVVPGDYLPWTEDIAASERAVAFEGSPLAKAKSKELRLAGKASERARAELESRGWKVVEGAHATLGG